MYIEKEKPLLGGESDAQLERLLLYETERWVLGETGHVSTEGSCGKRQASLWQNFPECTELNYEECRILFCLELTSVLGTGPPCC